MDQIILMVRIERIAARKIQQLAIDFFEVPRVCKVHDMRINIGFGRYLRDVGGNVEPWRTHLW